MGRGELPAGGGGLVGRLAPEPTWLPERCGVEDRGFSGSLPCPPAGTMAVGGSWAGTPAYTSLQSRSAPPGRLV